MFPQDLLGRQLNFSEAEFLTATNSNEIHIGDLTRMKVKILKSIPKDVDAKSPSLFIQNGNIVPGYASLKDGSFCSIAGYGDFIPQKHNIKARQSGKVIG